MPQQKLELDNDALRGALERVREQGIPYTAACADLDDARMACLAAELAGPDRRKEAR